MSPRFPRVSGKEMIQFLLTQGFKVVRIKGSHYILRNPEGRIATVPVHKNEILGIGITRKILQQADIPPEKFVKFLSGENVNKRKGVRL